MGKKANLIGRRDPRLCYAVVTALVAAVLAFPALAVAEGTEDGAVAKFPAPSPEWPWAHWSQERLEQAEPMPLVTLPEVAPEAPAPEPAPTSEAPTATSWSEGASTAGLRTAAAGSTAAVEGVEVTASESTVFPSSANGKVFGTYYIRVGAHEFEKQDYVCSGAVVNSPEGNVILTAGHCVIDPETGTGTSSELIFIPGYRKAPEGCVSGSECNAPFGVWKIRSYFITESWEKTAKAESRPNEGSDLAFIKLKENEKGESVEEAVQSLGIAFDKPCTQTYTQFGYPAESPYEGQTLYSHTTSYAGADTGSGFTPVPMKIGSDFTRGSSGGPWAIGVGSEPKPTVLSLTAYGYENQPGYLYGPYFGEAAKKAYALASNQAIPAGIEESCTALPPIPQPPTPTPTPTPTPPPTPAPTPETTPAPTPVTLKVTRVRRRANGSAVLTAKVNRAGMLKLSGTAVRAEWVDTPAAGKYRMVVAPKRATNRRLRHVGRARVGVRVAFAASGKIARVSRKIQLSRRASARLVRQHSRSRRRP
jgi:V8-like Glu-specific endopeptidase